MQRNMITSGSILKKTWPVVNQCAQAHRKPRWLPVAKSKIYRIPKRPQVDPEERAELQRINHMYNTQMRAIRRFYFDDMIKEKSTLDSASSEVSQRLQADEWARAVETNDKWNAQIAAEREERLKREWAEQEAYSLSRMEEKDRQHQEKIAKASAEIRYQKEQSATFITPETLEEAIERALANTVDYNFAIDQQGNQVLGRDTPIPPREKKAPSS